MPGETSVLLVSTSQLSDLRLRLNSLALGSTINETGGGTSEDPTCATTDWGQWSTCSVTCGRGVRTRSRRYVQRHARKMCSSELAQTEVCFGDEDCDEAPDESVSFNYYSIND